MTDVKQSVRRQSNRLKEANMRFDYKQGWKIVDKYAKYLERSTLAKIDYESKHPEILENLHNYNIQMFYEFKSCQINYINQRFYRVWVDTYNTITKNLKNNRYNAVEIIAGSVSNLTYVTTLYLEKNNNK
jgi:hypothetical protein